MCCRWLCLFSYCQRYRVCRRLCFLFGVVAVAVAVLVVLVVAVMAWVG